jgi:hypothetical protein
MLTIAQKANILFKVGITVPGFPLRRSSIGAEHPSQKTNASADQLEGEQHHTKEVAKWNHEVEALYVQYVVYRAAKSLRESEEANRMRQLRAANVRSTKSQWHDLP